MPLFKGKSKKSFSKNVASEMDAGKPHDQALATAYSIKRKAAKKMAKGGDVYDDHAGHEEMDERPSSVAEAIMRKRKPKAYADGGIVDLEDNAEESPADADELIEHMGKELYDDSQLEDQPQDSNEHGHELSDEDEHDMVEKIRARMRSLRR